jgi:D-lactate dehydrogenase
MSKILVTESNPRAKEAFSALEKEGHKVVHIEGIPKEHDILVNKDTEILSVFVNTAVTEKVIKGLPELKLIITRSTGIDHIGRETAQERNVCIANVPGYGTAPVAEQTFALLLSLLRKIVKADASIRAGKWEPFKFQGTNISGRTFGVIGNRGNRRQCRQNGEGIRWQRYSIRCNKTRGYGEGNRVLVCRVG